MQVKVVAVGKKVGSYYKRRPQYNLSKAFDMGNSPTTAEAQVRTRPQPPAARFWPSGRR